MDREKYKPALDTLPFLGTLLNVPLGRNLQCQKINRFVLKEAFGTVKIFLFKESEGCACWKYLHGETKSFTVNILHWKILHCQNLTLSGNHAVNI